MNEIVKHQTPASLPEKMQYAQALASSGMLPAQYRQQPANLLWALEFADSLGLHPMAAITGVHVIEGKPSASSALISALVRRAGHKLRVKGDDTRAVAQIVRADDPEFTFEVTWTLERAQQAGLTGKKVWKQYPAAMLKARAITEVAREACEEALSGMHYTPEELGAQVDAEGNPVEVEAEVTQLHRVVPGDSNQWTTPAPATAPAVPERDFVAEARTADDAGSVRRIWQEAKAAGETKERLGLIAAVGKSLTAGAPPPKPADADEVVDGEVVGPDEAEAQAAEDELRAYATEIGLGDVERDFESALGLPLSQAIAPQIRGFLTQLRGTAA
jgi:hypothetical protein